MSTRKHRMRSFFFVGSIGLTLLSQMSAFQSLPISGQGVTIEMDESTDPPTKYILDLNPADNTLIQKVQCTNESELDTKIQSLRLHQERQWSRIPLDRRVEIVRNALKHAFDDAKIQSEFARIMSMEMGKPLLESQEEVEGVADMKNEVLDLVYEANQAEELVNESAIIIRDPLGLIAVIAPWNYPAGEIMMHLIPALVAGNAVLVKPSEMTPLTGQFLVDRLKDYTWSSSNFKDMRLPIDIAQGDGEVGRMIVQHPSINSISMTGSSYTGKQIMKQSGEDLKRLILELGGKDPMIVFDDADLELAAKDAVYCSTTNCGQVCCSVERIYVDASIKATFEELCIKECQNVKAGPWDHKDTTIGPMVSQIQMERVTTQVSGAVSSGAKVLYTGEVLEEAKASPGNFIPATILTDLKQDMEITRTETFGPVIAIYEFDGSEEMAIELANDSNYGLSASVYSRDISKGARVASSIRAGQVAINAWALSTAPIRCPWVGHKESGFGYHSGKDGYKQFSVPKSIMIGESSTLTSNDSKKESDDENSSQDDRRLGDILIRNHNESTLSSTEKDEL